MVHDQQVGVKPSEFVHPNQVHGAAEEGPQ